jgi:hypothetical protein
MKSNSPNIINSRFINDFRSVLNGTPNLEGRTVITHNGVHLLLFTMRYIKQGEELLLDYGN